MLVGVPKEIKVHEYRVGLTPSSVREMVAHGHKVMVQTDATGDDSAVYVTTLAQCIKLTPGESPFFANYGIPAQDSIVTQIYPDFHVAKTQAQFAQFFAGLTIARQASPDGVTPSYRIDIVAKNGAAINQSVAV